VLLVLYERAIYVWVGCGLTREVLGRVLGVEPASMSVSFEVTEVGESVVTDLWTSVRSIRRLFLPVWIPVIVVPSESGKRVQLIEILECDEVKGANLVLQRYGELAKSVIV
jgi:hypothetical protein